MLPSKCDLAGTGEGYRWKEIDRKPFTSYPAFVCLIISLVNAG